jgi:hypothetical protein
MTRERHGIADAKLGVGRQPSEQSVTVTDGPGNFVTLEISTTSTAALTPDQAMFIAGQLLDSVQRLRKAAETPNAD